jgi:non-ribosomal peptide synthetase component F
VVVTHANVVGFVDWAGDYFDLGPSDRISQHPPLHFDLSIFDIFGASAAGAELHLVPPEMNLRPDRLTEFIRDSALTQWFSVPSVLGYLAKFDVVGQGDFPLLKRLLWCGEVLPTPTLVHFMRRLPHVQFTNLYGPTEATIASSYYTVPNCPEDPAAAIPIGRPCGGEDLLVLDGNLDPVGPGVAGDLYIRGIGLSPGYWEDRSLTRAAFLDGPPVRSRHARIYKTGDLARIGENGLIYFLGRADSQIKSRGYRIELGEIEAALETVGQLSAVAVVAIDAGGFEGATICCAYEPKNGAEVSARSLRAALGTKLPSYMIPTRWLAFDTLPKTANGKVDRQRLREEAKGWPLGRTAAAAAPGPRAGKGALASSGADEGV